MPVKRANGVELFYEVSGTGEPLVLVHGSWGDHHELLDAGDDEAGARRFVEGAHVT